jgi:hypothetical protein
MIVHSRIPLIWKLILWEVEENSPKSGSSQGRVQKGFQECLCINHCGISWPLTSYSVRFFCYEDSWSTVSWSLSVPGRHGRDSRQFIRAFLTCEFVQYFVCILLIKFYFQVKEAYINFLNHCYIDTEVEMKEIYTSNHMWSLFEKSFLVDMGHVANATHDRKHADTALENYIINSVMNIISTFFNSPFSDQSTTVQVCILSFPVN